MTDLYLAPFKILHLVGAIESATHVVRPLILLYDPRPMQCDRDSYRRYASIHEAIRRVNEAQLALRSLEKRLHSIFIPNFLFLRRADSF